MIRSNSKKAMENIRKFIIDHSDFTDYTFDDCKYSNLEDIKEGAGLEIFPQIANGIYTIFKNQKESIKRWIL